VAVDDAEVEVPEIVLTEVDEDKDTVDSEVDTVGAVLDERVFIVPEVTDDELAGPGKESGPGVYFNRS